MHRRDLLEDLKACQTLTLPDVVDVRQGQGDDSGTVSFTYVSDALPTGLANIQVLIPEPYDYPRRQHQYILYVENHENIPSQVTAALEAVTSQVGGLDLSSMIVQISSMLTRCLWQGRRSNPIQLDDDEDAASDGMDEVAAHSDEEAIDAFEDSFDGDDDIFFGVESSYTTGKTPTVASRKSSGPSKVDLQRIKRDLRTTKEAGFKIGVLGDLTAGGILCVSVRAVKLGISEEAMQAWGVQRRHYLVLMIKFGDGYRTLEQVSEMGTLGPQTDMRVALCRHYKPAIDEAMAAFASLKKGELRESNHASKTRSPSIVEEDIENKLEPMFITGPLNELLRVRFANIVKFRLACGVPWTGAERYINDGQGKSPSGLVMDDKYYQLESSDGRALKKIVMADAIADNIADDTRSLSLPLVAMQFLLRHFVRCTEFCLVCHCKVDATFEALKPYVCSKPLCLYQYINLGFGPSIEWEILTQPYVVDLLVSFCYVSARYGRLKEFPTGLDLNVPILPDFSGPTPGTHAAVIKPPRSYSATYNADKEELTFDTKTLEHCPVKAGTLMVLLSPSRQVQVHCRVDETANYPCISIGRQWTLPTTNPRVTFNHARHQPSISGQPTVQTPANDLIVDSRSLNVECLLYENAFDDLSESYKQQSICVLLDTLPNITAMQEHLLSSDQSPHPTLRGFIAEPVLNLLRWIIASNRSCIMQVQRTHAKHLDTRNNFQSSLSANPPDRVSGMEGWLQFRFAQGAPDKEQRFVDSVNSETGSNKHPSLFAWHGSPLANWHSIIREGLHFKETLHGRSFGDGVYMSNQASTSMGFSSHLVSQQRSTGSSGSHSWPQSVLKISQALSLQEVVNSPAQFRSRTPHYVVAQVDWIQTRYLFIRCDAAQDILSDTVQASTTTYEQDSSVLVYGERSNAIRIPITAVSKSRRPAVMVDPRPPHTSKKSKHMLKTDKQTAENMEDEANSVVSDLEDREYLASEHDSDSSDVMDYYYQTPPSAPATNKRSSDGFLTSLKSAFMRKDDTTPKSDFEPGKLDVSSLKILKPPKDAAISTTRELMKRFQEVLKVQDSTPIHELGWYIDRDLITNMYQWIVELHSFDANLPLAKDMKEAKVTSIVLEMRFTNSFPFSPPFVRVVRPRFLSFLAGGGGHVTAGGALCMELLTNNGWLVTNTIESVLLQIRVAMSSLEPRPARLQIVNYRPNSYDVGEAMIAYKRACMSHGWTVPKDFNTLPID